MMPRSAVRVFALFLILIAVGVLLATAGTLIDHLTHSAPLHIDERLPSAHVVIDADRTNVRFWSDCIHLSWQIDRAKSQSVNGIEYSSAGSQNLCGSDATFAVTLSDNVTIHYDVLRSVAFAEPSTYLLILTSATACAWTGLWLLGRAKTSPLQAGQRGLDALFRPEAPRLLVVVVIGALFLLGAAHWVSFFNRGHVALTSQDWALEQNYWQVMSRAAETQQIPFFITGGTRNTNNFLGNPETTLTPFLLLSPPLSPGQMALLTTLGVYAISVWGVLRIRRHFHLSLLTFTILFLLLNFNGFITAHLGVGHFMYLATLLLPFFVLALLQLAENSDHQTRHGLQIGLTFFGMELLGGYNFLVWCGEILVLVALCHCGRWRGVLVAAVSGLVLTAFRVLPAMLTFADQPHPFLAGFPTLNALLDSLMTIQNIGFLSGMNGSMSRVVFRGVPWWEFDMFISLLGLGFVLFGGVVLRFVRDRRLDSLRYPELDIPLLVMTMLALGDFYKYIATLPIPLVNVDRNSSRILILPLTILIVLAAARFELLLPELAATAKRKLALLAGLWLLNAHLMLHSQVWSIAEVERRRSDPFVPVPPDVIVNVSQKVLNLGDRLYVLSVPIGLVITLIALVVWIALYRRNRNDPDSEMPIPIPE